MSRESTSLCPACGADLACPPHRGPDGVWRAPSLLWDVIREGPRAVRDWRVSTFEGPRHRSIQQSSPGWDPRRTNRRYVLCGDGHIFLLDHGQVVDPDAAEIGDLFRREWNLLAAIGSVASGKSYLLARTMEQALTVTDRWEMPGADGSAYYESRHPDDLEDIPGKQLRDAYERTFADHVPMDPTRRDELLPHQLLGQTNGLVEAIMHVHESLAGEDQGNRPDPELWGRNIRQPVVLRSTLRGAQSRVEQIWTGVADLAGESMTLERTEDLEQAERLRRYNSLLWVIDPAVNPLISELVMKTVSSERHDGDRAENVIAASIRTDPGAQVLGTQRDRESRQATVAAHVANSEGPVGGRGARRRLLGVVNKCDLIREALAVDGFDGLSADRDAVFKGAARYLDHVRERSRDAGPGSPDGPRIPLSPDAASLVGRLHEQDMSIRLEKVRQLARGLVDYYGSPDHFWELVHGGGGAEIPLPAGPDNTTARIGPVRVPSLDEHLLDSLVLGQAGRLQVRDLVVSSLGCGITRALGHADKVEAMLRAPSCELRFYLCSPLGQTPTQPTGSDRVEPLNRGQGFPLRASTSAGLSQLLLAMLRGARA